VGLVGLADHERVDRGAPVRRGVHYRGGYRVRAEGQAADRVVGQVRGGAQEHSSDERREPAVQRYPAQVHVARGAPAGRQFEVAVHDALGLDSGQQFLAVIHASRAYGGTAFLRNGRGERRASLP
jgi:hypothetical protein